MGNTPPDETDPQALKENKPFVAENVMGISKVHHFVWGLSLKRLRSFSYLEVPQKKERDKLF